MKILFYTLNLIVVSCLGISAMAQDVNMVRELLIKTESAIPENYRDPVSVVEMRSSLKKMESFTGLQDALKISWKDSLPVINEIASNDTRKAIYFKAAQILPREEYIKFMIAASEQVAGKAVNKQQFKWALFPSEKHLREMWTEDPPSEPLKVLAQRAKQVLADDPSTLQFFNNVILGKVASDNRPPEQPPTSENATSIPVQPSKSEPVKSQRQSSSVTQSAETGVSGWLIAGALIVAIGAGVVLFCLVKK